MRVSKWPRGAGAREPRREAALELSYERTSIPGSSLKPEPGSATFQQEARRRVGRAKRHGRIPRESWAVRSLSLFFGAQVPLPAPLEISEALERVEIESAIGERGIFRLTFRADSHAPPEALLLPESGQLTRVSLVLREGSHASVIMEGVAVVHTLASGFDGRTSLVVSGEDLARVMDLVINEQSFPGMPPHMRVQVFLARYTAFGVMPLVIPPLGSTVPIPIDSIQHATDYAYIRALAEIAV